MIELLTPQMEETVSLMRPCHRDYIENPQNDSVEAVDWLNLMAGSQDLTAPLPLLLTYQPKVDARVLLGTRPDLSDATVLSGKAGVAEAINLLIGQEYFWRVETAEGVSPIGRFYTEKTPPRFLKVDGIANVRDIGGFSAEGGMRVKQGMVYRSSEMDRHVHITELGKEQMAALGMKTDLDIRGAGEEPHPVLDLSQTCYVNIPLAAYEFIFTEEQKERYLETYRLLCRPSAYPLFVHCWGGCDRTGTWLYILSSLLGVSEDDASLDYELSSFAPWGKRSRKSGQFGNFLKVFRTYGENNRERAENFLLECGVTHEEMETIRTILLEKAE